VTASEQIVREFRETFRLDTLSFRDSQGWTLSVRPGQITLGAMVISSSRGRLDFQDLDGDEAVGLSGAFALTERLAKDVFGAVRINLACLMMKDPIVHFHVVPRYDRPVERYGRTWEDADWPGPPTFPKVDTPAETLHALASDLKRAR
jgi:diadenosine tetraphosphate (Ap4A) HIT family hydrolase